MVPSFPQIAPSFSLSPMAANLLAGKNNLNQLFFFHLKGL